MNRFKKMSIAVFAVLCTAGCTKEDKPVSVTGVSLDRTELALVAGTKAPLVATVSPDGAANKAVAWSTSAAAVATVSDAGEVSAVAAGTATITVTAADGGKTASCAVTVTAKPVVVDVYVAGRNGDKATLWKNGAPEDFGVGSLDFVCIGGNDVYVAGGIQAGDKYEPAVWKNGVKLGYSFAGSPSRICVSSSDVYAVGSVYEYQTQKSTPWLVKNGVPQSFPDVNGSPVDICVAGGNVWTLLSIYDNGVSSAQLYRNGTLHSTVAAAQGSIYASALALSGNDVYVAGEIYDGESAKAALWKNGVLQPLADAGVFSGAHAICLSGGDVWIGGYGGNGGNFKACIWKNGVLYGNIEAPADAETKISAIAVAGDDIYASGYIVTVDGQSMSDHAALWKNGALQNLATAQSGGSGAASIAVKITN